MTDFDLESRLRSVPVPERPAEYWDDFPGRVRMQIPGAVVLAERPAGGRFHYFRPRLAWGGSLTLACVLLALASLPAFQAMVQNGKAFRRELAQLPVHLRVLLQDDHGLRYLIADQP